MSRIHCFSFNMSWATQQNVVAGSEADFVRACNRHERNCFENSIALLGQVSPLHLMGVQEVGVADLEARVQEVQPTLDTWHRACVWNRASNICVSASLLYNRRRMGRMLWQSTFDLDDVDGGRPCSVYHFVRGRRGVFVVHLHMPHTSRASVFDRLVQRIDAHMPKDMKKKDALIVLGDFNDTTTRIHVDRPLMLGKQAVSHGFERGEAKRRLKSCCWHEDGHEYQSMTQTGDYILTSVDRFTKSRVRIPKVFEATRGKPTASDHLPVEATVDVG